MKYLVMGVAIFSSCSGFLAGFISTSLWQIIGAVSITTVLSLAITNNGGA